MNLFVMEYYSCIVQHVTAILFGFMTIDRIVLIEFNLKLKMMF